MVCSQYVHFPTFHYQLSTFLFLLDACRDLFSIPNLISVNATLKTHKALVTKAYMIVNPDDPESMAYEEEEADWVKDYLEPGTGDYLAQFLVTSRMHLLCYLTPIS